MEVFTQIIILIAVLASMVMVLLAIRQLSHYESFDDEKETESLKKEVSDDGRIVSNNSIFHNLVDSEDSEIQQTKNQHTNKTPNGKKYEAVPYRSNSKPPLSREEKTD